MPCLQKVARRAPGVQVRAPRWGITLTEIDATIMFIWYRSPAILRRRYGGGAAAGELLGFCQYFTYPDSPDLLVEIGLLRPGTMPRYSKTIRHEAIHAAEFLWSELRRRPGFARGRLKSEFLAYVGAGLGELGVAVHRALSRHRMPGQRTLDTLIPYISQGFCLRKELI
jgi:hypothetical protein